MADLKKLGRYELRRVLGKGAMGVVYEGYDPTLSRRVAVKTILKSVALDEETKRTYAERFEREAKAVARLNHPRIVQVHDFGEQDEIAYLVLEFVEGRELRSFFDRGERFDVAETVRIMGELLDALEFAHERGVIHRDVKPANVMLDAQGHVKLADFGVARIQDSERSAAGTMVGTPAYMAPEQIQGGKIDRRADVFAAGVILYQMLTGEQPFQGEGAWTVARKIMQDEPKLPSSLVRGVSPIFDAVVQRALAKSAAERFSNARQFAEALQAARAGQRTALRHAPAPARAQPVEAKANLTEIEFWRSIQNSSVPAEFEAYLRQFPDGTYAGLAKVKLQSLRAGAASRREDETVAMDRPQPAPARRAGTLAAGIALAAIAAAGAYVFFSREPAPVAVQVPAAEIERISRDIEKRIRSESAYKSEAERVAAVKAATEKAVQERLAEVQGAQEKKLAQEKAEAEKKQAARAAAEKAAADMAAADKLAADKAAADKLAADKAAAEKIAQDKAAAEKAAAEKAAAEKAAAEKAAAEKAAAEKAAAEKRATNSEEAQLERFIQRKGRDKVLKQEPSAGSMQQGEVLYINDGTCGPGAIKEVTGGNVFRNLERAHRCVSLSD